MNYSFLFVIMSICLLHSSNSCAQEKIKLCSDSNVVVAYTKTEDYQLVCNSVNDVIEIAKKIGLSEELNITISIVERLIVNSSVKLLKFAVKSYLHFVSINEDWPYLLSLFKE